MRISDGSSDVCSSDLELPPAVKVIEASSGRLPLEVLIGLGAGSEEHIDSRHSHHDHHHDGDDHDPDHDAFDSISIELPQADERSEEHTSELQSLMRISYAVFCLKKKKKQYTYDK